MGILNIWICLGVDSYMFESENFPLIFKKPIVSC
jgi:hypothetical protein